MLHTSFLMSWVAEIQHLVNTWLCCHLQIAASWIMCSVCHVTHINSMHLVVGFVWFSTQGLGCIITLRLNYYYPFCASFLISVDYILPLRRSRKECIILDMLREKWVLLIGLSITVVSQHITLWMECPLSTINKITVSFGVEESRSSITNYLILDMWK